MVRQPRVGYILSCAPTLHPNSQWLENEHDPVRHAQNWTNYVLQLVQFKAEL